MAESGESEAEIKSIDFSAFEHAAAEQLCGKQAWGWVLFAHITFILFSGYHASSSVIAFALLLHFPVSSFFPSVSSSSFLLISYFCAAFIILFLPLCRFISLPVFLFAMTCHILIEIYVDSLSCPMPFFITPFSIFWCRPSIFIISRAFHLSPSLLHYFRFAFFLFHFSSLHFPSFRFRHRLPLSQMSLVIITFFPLPQASSHFIIIGSLFSPVIVCSAFLLLCLTVLLSCHFSVRVSATYRAAWEEQRAYRDIYTAQIGY